MLAILIWAMVGLAFWHFAVLVPDHFVGGIVGAFIVALLGGMASGWLLPAPGLPSANPPGIGEALWAIPGALVALAASYAWGLRHPLPWRRPGDA
jgi:hypothetical protein